MINASDFVKTLQLEELVPSPTPQWDIRTTDINRPGLQFVGYYDYFAYERPQVVGKAEMSYLESLDEATQRERLHKYFSYDVPCVIITRGMHCPPAMAELAAAGGVALYRTSNVTTKFFASVIYFLSNRLAPRVTRHGVLVDVYGLGILLTGESGVGKSEAALELIKRGHQLVADDVVDITRVTENRLVGESPEMVRHFMEIRGLGIIDIRAMYGIGSVVQSKSIDVVIHLELWREDKDYDRLGLTEEFISIMGVKLPYIVMPVRPGRNLAIIVEVAARNLRLKRMGYNAAVELDNRLNEMLQRTREPEAEDTLSEG